ncbi:MAG: SpoIIE family protein phosphatase [Verrucomicrobiota bacterium]
MSARIASQEFLHPLLDQANIGRIELHPSDGTIRFVSSAIGHWLDGAPESFVGRRLTDYVVEELRGDHQRVLERIAAGEEIRFYESIYQGADEVRIPLAIDGRLEASEDEPSIQLYLRPEDMISSQFSDSAQPAAPKTENVSLRHERYTLALRASNEGIWDWNLETDEIYFSDRIRSFLEVEDEEMPNIFTNLKAWVHPDYYALVHSQLTQYLRDARETPTLDIEARFQRKSGDYIWLRMSAIGVWDEQDRPLRLAGSMINISPRKTIEEALQEERHLLRTLIDNIPVHVYFKDKDSKFTLANQSQAELLGRSRPQEVIGKSDADFFSEQHQKIALADETKIMRTGQPLVRKLERLTYAGSKQDEVSWMMTSKMPLFDKAGTIRGTFGVSNDVTELVETQRKLQEASSKLEAKNESMQEEFALARELQIALLPQEMPTIRFGEQSSTLCLTQRFLPTTAVAGDIFHIVPISPTQVGVLVCDVMGHGVRAAMVGAILRGIIEEKRDLSQNPGQLIHHLNQRLVRVFRDADITMMATACYTLIDTERRSLIVTSAGHPMPLSFKREEQTCQPLGEDSDFQAGPALGLVGDTSYDTLECSMDTINGLLLYTDGIAEVENEAGEFFGEGAMQKTIGDLMREPKLELVDRLLVVAQEFSGRKDFDDDVTLIAIE